MDRVAIFVGICTVVVVATATSCNAWDYGLFPVRAGFQCWDLEHTIELQNNMTMPINFTITVMNPTYQDDFYRYDSGTTYNTTIPFNESTMHYYEPFPMLEWFTYPKTVTVEGKTGSDYVRKSVSISLKIPREKQYENRHFQCHIEANPNISGGIKEAVASRLLISTPEMNATPDGNMMFTVGGFLVAVAVTAALKNKRSEI